MLTGLLAIGHGWRRRRAPDRARAPAPPGGEVEGIDVETFQRVAQATFRELQAAFGAADRETLARLTLAPLCRDLCEQLHARGTAPDAVEWVELHARLQALERVDRARLARVEFSGRLRERPTGAARAFRELWWLARMDDDSASVTVETPGGLGPAPAAASWQVARVLALD